MSMEKMKKVRQQARRKIKQDEYSSPSESEDKQSKSKRKRMKINATPESGQKSIRGELTADFYVMCSPNCLLCCVSMLLKNLYP